MELMTSKKNCYFGVTTTDNTINSKIVSIYLLSNDGKSSFYAEIKHDDIPEGIEDDLLYPKKYVTGLNWKIRSTESQVRTELLKWMKKFYFDNNLDIQFVGDSNELEFVKLQSIIFASNDYKTNNAFVSPTMDNINNSLAELLQALSDSGEIDGYIPIAYHISRDDFISEINEKYNTFNADSINIKYKNKKTNNLMQRVWQTRDIKRFIVQTHSEDGVK